MELSPKRVFIGTCEIAGYYLNLTNGLKKHGVECDYVTFTSHPFKYDDQKSENPLVSLIRKINDLIAHHKMVFALKVFLAIFAEFFSIIYFVGCLFRYDVFIFGFGSSMIRGGGDLPILKFFHKKIIMNMAHGSDLRPPYLDGSYQSSDGTVQPDPQFLCRISRRHRKRIVWIEKYADYIIGAPFSSSQFSTVKFINTFVVGMPYQGSGDETSGISIPDTCRILSGDTDNNTIRILHSPSHSAAKGSLHICEAIERLRLKGYRINFIEVRNRPNAEVLAEIQKCDFVVDQVFSDTPMAGFAAEAGYLGKPAVVGGYSFDYLKKFIPESMFPPSQTCMPDEIEAAIEELIVNPELRKRLGADARAFVETQWSIEKVASRYLKIIEGDIPNDWWLDPLEVSYLYGAGQPESQTRENVRKLVERFGVKSLQLSHRPDLERAFLTLAGLHDPQIH